MVRVKVFSILILSVLSFKELLDDSAPFVTVNCAQYANNPELLTSQLFGHLKGAFTGADSDKIGAFQSAEGGVLF